MSKIFCRFYFCVLQIKTLTSLALLNLSQNVWNIRKHSSNLKVFSSSQKKSASSRRRHSISFKSSFNSFISLLANWKQKQNTYMLQISGINFIWTFVQWHSTLLQLSIKFEELKSTRYRHLLEQSQKNFNGLMKKLWTELLTFFWS